jgi:uridine kinase
VDLSRLDRLVGDRRHQVSRPVLVSLDGRSGTGKSTLAAELAERHHGRTVFSDDFWTGGDDDYWLARSPKQRSEEAIGWRRLRREALEPLIAGHTTSWHPFNWNTGQGLSDHRTRCDPAPVIVLDGVYSTRPELADIVDISVLLTLDDDLRRSRLLAREGAEFMRCWHSIWDPAEDYYFTVVRPNSSFDLVLTRG